MSSSANKTFLGDYVDFQNGYAFKSSDYTEEGHYLIRIKNVQQGFIEINDKCFVKIPNETKFEKFKLKNGDIVVSLTGNVGRIARIKDENLPAVLNQRVASVAPKDTKVVGEEYLYYLLRTPEFFSFAIGSGKGAAQQNISTADMEKFEARIPSLEKQRKIVEKLDNAFAEIDSLEKNLQLKEEKTNQLLQSMLSAAFTYTEEFLMKTSYETGTIDEMCHVEYGTRVVRKRDAGSMYPVYGGGGETFYLDSFNRENRVVIARFAMSEKCTRKVSGKFSLNDSGLTLSPKNVETLRQDYLDYWTLSLNDVIYEKARGTAQKNLDMPAFRKIELTFPSSMELQKLIVEKLDKAFAEIEKLKNQILIEKERISSLRQTILSNAFNFEEKAA